MVNRLIRVALVAHAEADFQHVCQTFASLNGPYKLTWFRDHETALSALEPTRYDVYLMADEMLSRSTAVPKPLHPSSLNIPVILLCHHGPPDAVATHPDLGAMDCLSIRDLAAAQLARSIHYAIERHRLLEALRVAQDAANVAQRMQYAFLAIMSDEIRTPMNGVIGMAELLMETELTKEQQRYANTICTSGRLLATVINDILDISKLQAGYTCLEQKAFNLYDLVDGVMTLFTDHVQHKGLDLAWSIFEDVPAILVGDSLLLQQLLINMISNAVKFTKMGRIDIQVTLEDKNEDMVCICFEIQDTGIGIPLELHDQLFQKFAQADMSNTRKQGGIGLGLAIARHIVMAMQGSITFESQPEQGSTFWCKVRLLCPPPRLRRF